MHMIKQQRFPSTDSWLLAGYILEITHIVTVCICVSKKHDCQVLHVTVMITPAKTKISK